LFIILKIKNMKLISIVIVSLLFLFGCKDKGVSEVELSGFENNLPAELKGLRVYNVSTGNGGYIKVAILNNSPVVTKIDSHITIIMGKNVKDRIIYAKQIISETDSIIVIKK
jgi:hypothetical protein